MKLAGAEIPEDFVSEVEARLGHKLSKVPEQAFSEFLWHLKELKFEEQVGCCFVCTLYERTGLTIDHSHNSDADRLMKLACRLMAIPPERAGLVIEGNYKILHLSEFGGSTRIWSEAKQGYISVTNTEEGFNNFLRFYSSRCNQGRR